MTVAMSSEGESAKSALSEANEKSGSDVHTDTSQDSADAKPPKDAISNNVEKKDKDDTDKPNNKSDDPPEEPMETDSKDADVKKDEDQAEEEPKKEEEENDKEAAKEKGEESEEKEGEEAEEEEEEEEEKKGVPLLDQPLETSGKRERKSVQRLDAAGEQKEKEKDKDKDKEKDSNAKVEFENGSGTALGDIARIDASIARFKTDDLKHLHKLLFKTVAKPTFIKRNIKKFNGFEFKKDSEEYKKKLELIRKLDIKILRSMCEMLDLAKTGSKDDVSEKILDFLLEPKDSGKAAEGKAVAGGRPKRASAIRANNRGYSSHDDYSSDDKQSRARREKAGKRSNLKDESSSDEEFKPDGDGSDVSEEGRRAAPRTPAKRRRAAGRPRRKASSDEDDEEASASDSEDSDFEEGSRTKRRKSTSKANSKAGKKGGAGRGRGRPKASGTPAKRAAGRRGRKPKESSEEEEEESDRKDDGATSSSEDEPLVKKSKNAEPPTDEEIKTFIKSVLEGANLEEITMKTVCQRVYQNYPDFDLSHKKDFIKTTVKSLIST